MTNFTKVAPFAVLIPLLGSALAHGEGLRSAAEPSSVSPVTSVSASALDVHHYDRVPVDPSAVGYAGGHFDWAPVGPSAIGYAGGHFDWEPVGPSAVGYAGGHFDWEPVGPTPVGYAGGHFDWEPVGPAPVGYAGGHFDWEPVGPASRDDASDAYATRMLVIKASNS